MEQFLNTKIPLWVVGCWILYMAAVQSLPRPTVLSKPVYIWIFQTLHTFSINIRLLFDPLKKTGDAHVETVTVTQTRSDSLTPPAAKTPENLETLTELATLPPAVEPLLPGTTPDREIP
jgi:hypothetical protein